MRPQQRLPRPQQLYPHRICHLLLSSLLLSFIPATAQTPRPTFEVATVKPAPPETDPKSGSWSPPGTGRFTATHVSLALLIQLAYGIDDSQIVSKLGWLETNLYDVAAKPEDGVALTRDELKPRLQDLLQQRFHLVAHSETRLSRGYALVVAEGGAHLTPTKGDHFPGFRIHVGSGEMRGVNWSMPQLAKYLTSAAGFPVVDQTGISGSYDIDFRYNPKPDADSGLPALDVALKQATGLLLKPQKVPVETVVVESADKVPTANWTPPEHLSAGLQPAIFHGDANLGLPAPASKAGRGPRAPQATIARAFSALLRFSPRKCFVGTVDRAPSSGQGRLVMRVWLFM